MGKLGWCTLLAVAAAACADPQGPRPDAPALGASEQNNGSNESARRKLLAADQAHAAASAATGKTGFLASLDDDVLFLLPLSRLAEGKAAAEALLDAPPFPFAAGMKLDWTPVFAEASEDGQAGYTFGNVRIADGAVPGLLGQYIAFWSRDGESWRVKAWSFSGAGAEPGPPPDFGHFPLYSERPAVDQQQVEQDLLDTDAAFSQASVSQGQGPAFRDYADLNAVVLGGGDPDFIIGRQAIYELRLQFTSQLSWTPRFAGVGRFGDLGFTVGNFVNVTATGTRFGKYLTIWKKQAEGDWKFVQDGGSSTPPPAP
jgi:ketosteroid isomerase-like protein